LAVVVTDIENPGVNPGTENSGIENPGLVRTARGLALATTVSRVTGFARVAALTAVLGLGPLRQAFEIANTLPNTLFELLLGGVLSSTLVPLLVEARAKGQQQALAFAQRILTVVLLATAVLAVIAVLAAPLLVRAYNKSSDPDEIALSIRWARFFLPQIMFYALTAVVSAVLNTYGRFGAAVWAPVLNNVTVIATVGIFALLPGPASAGVTTLTEAQVLTLGLGTTLGVVLMTMVLLPFLRVTGFRWRLRLDLRGVGLRRMARLGAWVLVYVAATQVAYWVLTGLATGVGEQPTYVTAFTVWQLPHAVVAVSLITALLPRMSAHAVAGRFSELHGDLDRGLRLSTIVLLPAAVAFAVLGREISTVLFNHGATDLAEARRVGWVLAVFAVGLLPFSVYQLQSRAFYAMRDTRTPALVQCAVSAVLIVVDVVLSALLPDDQRVFGLAAGHAAAYSAGVMISAVALRRRLGPALDHHLDRGRSDPNSGLDVPQSLSGRQDPGWRGSVGFVARLLVATLLAAVAAGGLAALLHPWLSPGPMGSFAVLLAAGSLGVLVYLGAILTLAVPEARAGLRRLRGSRTSYPRI
jgi:putative peptidoglycan lipid II flippase